MPPSLQLQYHKSDPILCALWESERTRPGRTAPMESFMCAYADCFGFSFDSFFIWRSQNPPKFSAKLFTCNSKGFRGVFAVPAVVNTLQKADALCRRSKIALITYFSTTFLIFASYCSALRYRSVLLRASRSRLWVRVRSFVRTVVSAML